MPDAQTRPPLGVGMIIGRSFSIFFRRLHWLVLLTGLPVTISLLVSYGLFWGKASSGLDAVASFGSGGAYLLLLFQIIGGSLSVGFGVHVAYAASLDRHVRFRTCLSDVFGQILPLVICAALIGLAVSMAGMFLFVPGLWIMAVWSVVIPALVVERGGFNALGRSADLTKGYRWPIVGVLLISMFLVPLFLTIGSAFLISLMADTEVLTTAIRDLWRPENSEATAAAVYLWIFALSTLINILPIALISVVIAVIYSRLREIKEGAGIETVPDVFD